jgi:hypothetical protein
MIRTSSVWSKVKHDLALNLSELAIASGYDRGVLAKMDLPLEAGKLPLSDFRRILRRRQDHYENQRRKFIKLLPDVPTPEGNGSARTLADKFHEPRSKRDRPGASRPRAGSRALCSA